MAAVVESLGAGKGTMPEYNPLINTDPQYEDWDGNPNTIASWILDATYRVETSGTSDQSAIRFSKLKPSAFLNNLTLHRGCAPATLKAFTELLMKHFYHVNWAI